MSLGAPERTALLRLARATLHAFFEQAPAPEPTASVRPALEAHQGAFVSLHGEGGALRGCVGTFRQDMALWRVVAEMAIAAARNDTRFAPVDAAELPRIDIELSVLSPRREIGSPDEIVIGRHGLWLERGLRRGVLLPQVATEHGMDVPAFLEAVARKAGLPREAWRDAQTTLCVFEAEVFSERGERAEA